MRFLAYAKIEQIQLGKPWKKYSLGSLADLKEAFFKLIACLNPKT